MAEEPKPRSAERFLIDFEPRRPVSNLTGSGESTRRIGLFGPTCHSAEWL